MKAPNFGPRDLVHYGAFFAGILVGSFGLTAFGITGIARGLGALALGWAMGFLVDHTVLKAPPEE